MAMGLYSLEIQLKVLICKRLNLDKLPKAFEIHELESLLVLCGLQAASDSASPDLRYNWAQIVNQSLRVNDMRYKSSTNWTQADAQAFLQQLRDPPDGVLPWLSAQPLRQEQR
jgi:hypothetical protein